MFGYTNNNYMGSYIPPVQPRPMPASQQMQQYIPPFQDVRFVNEKEADGYIVLPNQKVLLIDVANKKMWIKWADSLGQSNTETYKFEPLEEQKQALEEKPAFDTSIFAQKDDIKNMATRQDLDVLKQTIEKLEKQVKINQILAEKPAQPKAE